MHTKSINIGRGLGLSKSNSRRRQALAAATFEALETRRMMDGDPEPPDPIEQDFYEPNNSFVAAYNLGTTNAAQLEALTLHNFPSPNDVDYFKFTAASSGAVGVQIQFRHMEGNLQLTAYNAQQQQIAHSNSSTVSNGQESFALNLTAGQTYFIKASGATSGVSQPDYSMAIQPLTVNFDWNMPRRFGATLDQWGLPIVPNTSDYARPSPVVIGGVEHPQFGVLLDAAGTFLGSTSVTYNWHITSPLLTRDLSTGSRSTVTDLPEGQYTVTLTAVAGSNSLSTTKTINVVDHLIVAMGDSYGSGEGNPHQGQQYDWLGFTTSGAKWAQGFDSAITSSHRRSHRSGYAGVVQAALQLENSDPKSSVTFVFLDHTGAEIPHLINTWQESSDTGETGSDAPQIEQMAGIVGSRRVDGLVLSIGGNDAGFFDVASRLVLAEPGSSDYQSTLNQIWADADAYRNDLVSNRYPALAQHLATLNIGQVFLTEYPDPTHDSTGGTAQRILHDIADPYEIDFSELVQVRNRVMIPLAGAMMRAARQNQWCYVTDIASAFGTHGYGDWFRTAADSVVIQGPLGNRNWIGAEDRARTTGTLHPISGGLDAQRDRINAALTQPNLVTTGFSLTPNAFLPGATDGFSMTVRNTSVTAWASQSTARIYISQDQTFSQSDIGVLDVTVPAIGPGQSVTLTGVLPVMGDPIPSWSNLEYVAPILDVTGAVAESIESDNAAIGVTDTATIHPERDIVLSGNEFLFDGRVIAPGVAHAGAIGTDEFIGDRDIDLFAVDVLAGQRLGIDIDSPVPNGVNTYIRVYPMSGNRVLTQNIFAANDDGLAPGESPSQSGESYLQHTFPSGGRYCIVVSHINNADSEPMMILGRQHGYQGQYTIQLSNVPTTPPAVLSSSFDVNTRKLQVTFSQDVVASLNAGDVEIRNLTGGQLGSSSHVSATYNAQTDKTTAIFSFNNAWLTDGNHTATIRANSVSNPFGQPMSQDHTAAFFILSADVNRDRRVDVGDQMIIGEHMGQSGQTFTTGDVNYDGTVNSADVAIFDAARNQWLPAQGPLAFSGYKGIRLKNESAALVEIHLDSGGVNPVIERVFRGAVTSIDYAGGGTTENLLTLDFTNGNPIPPAGVTYNGNAGNDAVYVIGAQGGVDTVNFATSGITFGAGPSASHTNVETLVFDGRGGWDNLSVGAGATLTLSTTQWLNSLNVMGTVVSPSDPILGLSTVTRALSIGSNAKLDLNENDLILDYTGGSPLSTIQSLVNSARAGGAWTGNGLTSSRARTAASHNTTLGVMEATTYKSVYGPASKFDGQVIDNTAVLVKYTYYGDTDFNGQVDFDDYINTDFGYNSNGTNWFHGDNDGNGAVDFDDYTYLDLAFNTQGATL